MTSGAKVWAEEGCPLPDRKDEPTMGRYEAMEKVRRMEALVLKQDEEIERLRAELAQTEVAYNLVQKDCQNLTEKVIPAVREAERERCVEIAEAKSRQLTAKGLYSSASVVDELVMVFRAMEDE